MSHVIIVDDQASNRLLLSALARSIELGVTIAAFEDPATALVACLSDDPDLIITDYKMNGMTGAEFIRRLRTSRGCGDVPVIVLTVYDERAFRMEALAAGATDFLLSPVDHAEFTARGRNLLKLRSQQRLIESRATNLARALEQSEQSRQEAIRESREALAQVIDTVPAFIMAADRDSTCLFVNASQASYAGGLPHDFAGQNMSKLVGSVRLSKNDDLDRHVFASGQSIKSYEEDIEGAGGVVRTFLTTKTPLRDAKSRVMSVVTTSLDITPRKQAEERLTRMALHDALTDLPNRYRMDDLLQRLAAPEQLETGSFALLFVDLDRFKTVNDSFGHHVGNAVLKQIAQRLLGCCRPGDTVARLGGDEFAILQASTTGERHTTRLAQRVVTAIAQPLLAGGVSMRLTASVGITLFPADGRTPEILQRNADRAMYQAKAEGKNRFRFFRPAMNERAATAIQMEDDLRRALDAGQFRLHYQPLLDLQAGRVVGFEALIRWQRPGYGLLSPDAFLAVAEETGLVAEIGSWVLQTALHEAVAWQVLDGRPIRIAINVSPMQFIRQDIADLVEQAVIETGLAPSLVNLELTEGTLLDDSPNTMATLRKLSALGVRLSIDDFGTGFASMNYIKRVPISHLKIDRSFVRDFPTCREDVAVVRSLVALGQALDIPILAEGVETIVQLEALRAVGCDEVQGFLIGRPVDADAVPDLIYRSDAGWKSDATPNSRPAP